MRRAVALACSIYTMRPFLFRAQVSAETPRVAPAAFRSKPDLPDINKIFDLINTERAQRGLRPVERSSELTRVANKRAADMATKHYYAHKNPEGQYFYDLFKQNDVSTAYACENLDLEFVTTASLYVNDWLTSTHGHRECMLNHDVTEAGFAVTPFTTTDPSQSDTKMYIVVTIYSQPKA
jgi:uncharacterized protein YkwD